MNIPRIIHQLWVNKKGSPVPEKYKYHTNSLRSMNPDFDYKMWTDNDINELFKDKTYKPYWEIYNNLPYSIMKADVARWVILHKYGGVYSDLDFIGLKPLSQLLEQYPNNSLIMVCEPQHKLSYSEKCYNGFVLADKEYRPCLKVISTIVEACKLRGSGNGHVDVINLTGPGMVHSVLSSYAEFSNSWIIPRKYILPVLGVYDPLDDDGSAYVSTIWVDGTNWVSEIAVDIIKHPIINYALIVPILIILLLLVKCKMNKN